MKKIIMFVIYMCFISIDVIIAEENYIAKCVYENTELKQEFTLQVNKDYVISASGNVFDSPDHGITEVNPVVSVGYSDFMNSEKNFDCGTISSLYVNKNVAQWAYETVDYTVQKTQGNNKYVYSLNKEKSSVNSDNYDAEDNKNNGWLKTCHYGMWYLKFNKKTYETNITKLVDPNIAKDYASYNDLETDVMKYLSDHNYSCPTSLCYEVDANLRKVSYEFINDITDYSNCIVSQSFTGKYTCGMLDDLFSRYEAVKMEIPNSNTIGKKKEIVNNISLFCSSAFNNLDYNDETNCVKECMELEKVLSNDSINSNSKVCGFSEKLIMFIANIVKWIKYIIPVLVIVFGIIDFIKATGADKEDEMKKAQKNFVIRLIAAAIVFITPIIIEFILTKMGFNYNGCGIIDL